MATKDPGLAVVLAIVFPGMGQVYNEEFLKAIFLVLSVVAAFILLGPIGIFIAVVIWLFSIWDAYTSAS